MYYKLPFDFGKIIAGKDAELSASIGENIAQHIELLVMTKMGEHRFDNNYGNEIWELEFENSLSDVQWEEHFRISVIRAVAQYEPRLLHPDASIHSEQVKRPWPLREYNEIKKRVVIVVKGILADTGETFSFRTELFLSPMSVD